MKKAGILLIAMSLVAVISQAQNRQGQQSMMSSPGVQQIVMMYGDQIDITNDQLAEIIEKQLEYRETMRSARMQSNRANRGQQQRQVRQVENLRGQHSQSILRSVLSDAQMNRLTELMKNRAEYSHNYMTIRHQKIVDRSGLEGDKKGAVLEVMNRHADQRHQLQLKMIENPSSVDAEERQQMMDQMRADMDDLKSMLTVEEYENLMQLMGQRQNRPNNRMNQRPNNRRQNR